MKDSLKTYLLLAGALGTTYAVYNYFSQKTISLKMTTKVAQEIKHQMMIVTINFAEGVAKHAVGSEGKIAHEKVNEYFVDELSKIYRQKEELILSKYTIPSDIYANSLKRYSGNKKLNDINEEILDMMQRCVKGIVPDLSVPQ